MEQNRMQERMHQCTEDFAQATSRGMETVTAWLDANRRMWLDSIQLSTETTRQNVRLWCQLQSSAIELWTASMAGWAEAQREAAIWYEKAVRDGMEGLQRAVGAIVEDGARTLGQRGGRRLEALPSQWRELREKIRQQWGQLTDEELDQIQGNPDALMPAGTLTVLARGEAVAARIAPRRLQSFGTASLQAVRLASSAGMSTLKVAAATRWAVPSIAAWQAPEREGGDGRRGPP